MSKSSATIKREILLAAQKWFKEVVIPNHVQNTKKLVKPSEHNIHPFLVSYIANFLTGSSSPESIAAAMLYPRVLGTSITTSFGTNLQLFIPYLKDAFSNQAAGSTTSGVDIEFVDQVDKKKMYCQLKAGVTTINKGDISSIHNDFKAVRNLARTNGLTLNSSDFVIGILYGERKNLNAHYKKLASEYGYNVYVGEEFWTRLTGDKDFYFELSQALAAVPLGFDSKKLLQDTVEALAKTDIVKKLSGQ